MDEYPEENMDDIRCPECGAISFEGCQQRGATRCEWLRGQPDPMDELEGYP